MGRAAGAAGVTNANDVEIFWTCSCTGLSGSFSSRQSVRQLSALLRQCADPLMSYGVGTGSMRLLAFEVRMRSHRNPIELNHSMIYRSSMARQK
jgi:hypothetical protein